MPRLMLMLFLNSREVGLRSKLPEPLGRRKGKRSFAMRPSTNSSTVMTLKTSSSGNTYLGREQSAGKSMGGLSIVVIFPIVFPSTRGQRQSTNALSLATGKVILLRAVDTETVFIQR